MAIGTGALITAGLISAGGGIAQAKMQSNAAKKASKAQQQASMEAQRYMQQGLGQLGSLYAPYINGGAGAMGTLGRLTTPGPGARYASPGPPNVMPGGTFGQMMPSYQPRPGGPYPPQQ